MAPDIVLISVWRRNEAASSRKVKHDNVQLGMSWHTCPPSWANILHTRDARLIMRELIDGTSRGPTSKTLNGSGREFAAGSRIDEAGHVV